MAKFKGVKTYFLPAVIGLIIVVVSAIGLIIASTLDLARGPAITEIEPKTNTTVSDPLITVTGQTERINRLYFNDRQIFADPTGQFSERLLLLPGYNILTIRAEDRFEREVVKQLELVYKLP